MFVCGVNYREEDYMVPEDDDDVSHTATMAPELISGPGTMGCDWLTTLCPDWLMVLYLVMWLADGPVPRHVIG